MLNHYINLNFLKHLNSYDLVYKFNYQSYYLLPSFTKISLKIFLKGVLNSNLYFLYLKNFLLLFLYCLNNLSTGLKFKKVRRKKAKFYNISIFIEYFFNKNTLLKIIFDFFFLLKKFSRPFFFSNHKPKISRSGGKFLFFYSKIIIFIPSLMLLDHKEHKIFPSFSKSKVFFSLSLKIFLSFFPYNFFTIKKLQNFGYLMPNNYFLITKNFLKNFLLVWCLI